MTKFKSASKKGFTMTFNNGWTISVQWGYGNYCDNNYHPDGYYFDEKKKFVESSNAEIAIWDDKGEWYNFGSDTVKGYCSTDEVAEWIDKVSKF